MKRYYVYIMASRSRVLYVGVTNDLARRIREHKEGRSSFTRKYNATRLVYVEAFGEISDGLAREKQLKGWRRAKKTALIEQQNPEWTDGSEALICNP